MTTPVIEAAKGLIKAYLEIEQPIKATEAERKVPVKFNPTEYQLQKTNTFAEIGIPGLESPPIQFIRGGCEKLTTDLIVDTSDTLEDVRVKYVNALRGLMNIAMELHAPPIVRLVWGGQVFRGVMESLTVTYNLFRPDGVPIRAKLAVALKEYRPVEIQIRQRPKASPDFDKVHVVQRGDTLSALAHKVYLDVTKWREIALANEIRDPRQLQPGRTLRIPKIRF